MTNIYAGFMTQCKKMKAATNFIDFFVHDILDFTVLEERAENFTKNLTVFDVREAIDQILVMMEDKVNLQEILVRTRYLNFDESGYMIKTDMKRFQQVLLNLYSNAIKFTQNQGKITIEVEKEDGMLLIKVIDNGTGIRKRNQNKMFQMFGTIKEDNPQGIGLGLCICK